MKIRAAQGQLDLLAWRPRVAVVVPSRPVLPVVAAFLAWQARPNARTMGLFLAAARPVLLRHLTRHLRDDPAAAEDLAQNCLLRMAEAGALFTFKGTGDLSSWIAVVARNAAVSYLRAPARLEIPADDEHRPEERSPLPSPEDDALRRVDRDRIVRGLARLDGAGHHRYARILRSYYLHGSSLKQIAMAEGLPYVSGHGRQNSAKGILYRARKALRREIEDDELDP